MFGLKYFNLHFELKLNRKKGYKKINFDTYSGK
jgi:hypothetical protein